MSYSPWDPSIQQSQTESFIRLESYKESAQREWGRVVAGSGWHADSLRLSWTNLQKSECPEQSNQKNTGYFAFATWFSFISGPEFFLSRSQSALMYLSYSNLSLIANSNCSSKFNITSLCPLSWTRNNYIPIESMSLWFSEFLGVGEALNCPPLFLLPTLWYAPDSRHCCI